VPGGRPPPPGVSDPAPGRDSHLRSVRPAPGPLVLFTRGADCLPTQDALDDLAGEYRGRVNFLSVNARDDPADVRGIAQERGWSLPVGYDRDGAVSDLYRVGGCPTVAFAYPGGILAFAKAGIEELSNAGIEGEASSLRAGIQADVQRLLRESRAHAAEDR
jgi:hypothetical protein